MSQSNTKLGMMAGTGFLAIALAFTGGTTVNAQTNEDSNNRTDEVRELTPVTTGDYAEVVTDATNYSTEENIPSWVRSFKYEVIQSDDSKVLLGGINSWVSRDGIVLAEEGTPTRGGEAPKVEEVAPEPEPEPVVEEKAPEPTPEPVQAEPEVAEPVQAEPVQAEPEVATPEPTPEPVVAEEPKQAPTEAKAEPVVAETPKEEPASPKASSRTLSMEATAYTAFCDTGCTGVTATGIDVSSTVNHQGRRVVAVDPSVIPLGTPVRVSYGGNSIEAISGDTGGNIKGNRIDVLMSSKSEARSFGRQTVTVDVLN